jgi:CO/xanthine dehydrogenase FAD-binding subunit
MKPPNFLYARPESLEEALALMASHGGDAKILAGGQSLMPMLNLRLAEPKLLIDLNRLPGLTGTALENGRLRVGAMTRHRELETSREAAEAEPMLARAAREIGHLAIRNRGTIGGSIAHADPSAEWPLLAVALDAQFELRSAVRTRNIGARDFFAGPFTTCAEADELLAAITFPLAPKGSGFGFQEMCRRTGDFAIVAVACRVRLSEGKCVSATLAVGGADATPRHIDEVAEVINGSRGEDSVLREAGAVAARTVDPSSDLHGSAEFRRKMVTVLTRRALEEAFAAAGDP